MQGASGTQSPTITAGSTVDYNLILLLALAAINQAGQAIADALNGAGAITNQSLAALSNVTNGQAQSTAADAASNSDILQQALAAEQQLAAAQGTGGASLTSQSTNYLIWGAIGVALLAVFALLFHKK